MHVRVLVVCIDIPAVLLHVLLHSENQECLAFVRLCPLQVVVSGEAYVYGSPHAARLQACTHALKEPAVKSLMEGFKGRGLHCNHRNHLST